MLQILQTQQLLLQQIKLAELFPLFLGDMQLVCCPCRILPRIVNMTTR